MATRLLLISDTHVPARARRLPDQVWRAVDEADLVVHAGDWVDVATLDALEARAARLVGVVGNNDGAALRARLPELARFELDGVRFGVVHETGPATGRELRMDAAFAGPRSGDAADGDAVSEPDRRAIDVLVFGHSHIPWDTTTPRGIRLLNPGSPTDRRRQPVCSVMTAVVDAGVLRDLSLVPVER
jgi:putative phosphoesterase